MEHQTLLGSSCFSSLPSWLRELLRPSMMLLTRSSEGFSQAEKIINYSTKTGNARIKLVSTKTSTHRLAYCLLSYNWKWYSPTLEYTSPFIQPGQSGMEYVLIRR